MLIKKIKYFYQTVHAAENPLKMDQYKSMATSFGISNFMISNYRSTDLSTALLGESLN